MRRFGFVWSLGLALLLACLGPAAFAQVSATGNVYGTVTDESGAVLPGATATLSGPLGNRTTTTGSSGDFRFLNLDHGTYKLNVGLTGFSTVSRDVTVAAGTSVNLPFTLKVASVEETITVQSETPAVDTKKTGTGTTISKEELANVPSSRDPWALMRTIPGVLVDRVNVAGSESGQQSNFIGKGADPKDATWSLDGVVVTDMSAIGASPTYFTYDSFDQVSFATGGNDVRVATGGIGIGLVTKRGTNAFHGSANGYFTDDKLQSSNLPDELKGDPRLRGSDKADHTDQIGDYSVDLGGPLVKDKLWFYGSYEKNDIRIRNLRQARDKTVLKNYLGRLNWQATGSDMVSLFWFNGAKIKLGRAGSAANFGLPNTEGTFWDQGNFYPGEPHGFSKVEWNHVFSPSLFLTAKGSYYSTGFTLAAQGNNNIPFIIDNVAGVARGTANTRSFSRPMYTANLDGSYFASGLGGSHELKFGGSWRRTDATSTNVYPAGGLELIINGGGADRARFYRETATGTRTQYTTAYLADTFSRGRLTLNLGVRYDHQTGVNLPTSVSAHPLIPDDLPGLDYPGGGAGVKWNDLSPRAGLTYAVDDHRKTVLRASFARYAGQLSLVDAGWDNPLGTTFLEYEWNDANHDGQFQASERGRRTRVFGFDPANPNAVSSVQQIDPSYHSNKDNEIGARAGAEPRGERRLHVAEVDRPHRDAAPLRLLLVFLDRREPRRLPSGGAGDAQGLHRDPLAARRHRGRERDRRPAPDQSAGLPPQLQRARAVPGEAPLQQVDGARRVLIQRLEGVFRPGRHPGSDQDRSRPADRRRPGRFLRRRLGKVLLREREVAGQPKRPLPAAGGIRDRRQPVRAARLSEAVHDQHQHRRLARFPGRARGRPRRPVPLTQRVGPRPAAGQEPQPRREPPAHRGGRGLQRVQRQHGDVPHHRGHVERPRPAQRDPGSAHRPHQR